MISKKVFGEHTLRFLAILFAGAIFISDLYFSEFNTGGILFQSLFILSLWIPSRQNNILLASLCTVFILTGYWWRQGLFPDSFDLFSRSLSILGIWSIAIVGARKNKLLEAITAKETRLKSLVEERTLEERENYKKQNQKLHLKLRQLEDETGDLRNLEQKHRIEKETAVAEAKAYASFLDNMGHEMQAPMHCVIETASGLAASPLDKKQREQVYTMRSAAESLHALTDDLLDYARLEAGEIEIEQRPFVLRHCIENAFDHVASRAAQKNIELTYVLDPRIPVSIISDEHRVKQILTNLIGNAVQRSDEGEVLVTSKLLEKNSAAHLIYFSIMDAGPHIPCERIDALFNLDHGNETERLKRLTEIGIGLSLSTRLCNLLNGKIWVESEGDRGATFQFVIPVQKAGTQHIPLQGKPWFIGKHVLVVDDNPYMCRFLNHQLKNWGMQTTVLSSGPEAMRWYAEEPPCDLALIDLDMPVLDGLTLAHQIRQNDNALPIILMTAQGEYISDPTLSATIVKPVKQKRLYDQINAILSLQSTTVEESRALEKSRIEK